MGRPGTRDCLAYSSNLRLSVVERNQVRQIRGVSGLAQDSFHLLQNLFDGHGIHFAAVVVAGLDGLLQVAAGDLRGQLVGFMVREGQVR